MNRKLRRIVAVGLITTLTAGSVWAVGPMSPTVGPMGPSGGVPMGSVQVQQPR
jgi:hypothetical protein